VQQPIPRRDPDIDWKGWIGLGLVAAWIVFLALLVPLLAPPWLEIILYVGTIAPFLLIGIASRANIWGLLVWLGPLAVFYALWLAGIEHVLLTMAFGVSLFWAIVGMFFQRISSAVFDSLDGILWRLTILGLRGPKRQAYRDFRKATGIWDDSSDHASARSLREIATRIEALTPPDDRWAALYRAFVDHATAWAEMVEGVRKYSSDELTELGRARDALNYEVLRDESVTFRFLMFVPRS
jgi:hypothetical protein